MFQFRHAAKTNPQSTQGPIDASIPKKTFFQIFPLFFKWVFKWVHPDIGVAIAQYLSVKNKLISGDQDAQFLGNDNEWLVQYCKRKLEENHRDYFVFGHRHLPLEIPLNTASTYINLGDWIQYFTYGVFDGNKLELKTY